MTDTDFGQWKYQAEIDRIVDGDTLDVTFDLGFHTHRVNQRLRLGDVNTAEIHGVSHSSEEYATGLTHKRFVETWVVDGSADHDGGWPFIVETEKDATGRYGRWLADVIRKSDGDSLSSALLSTFGESVRYDR